MREEKQTSELVIFLAIFARGSALHHHSNNLIRCSGWRLRTSFLVKTQHSSASIFEFEVCGEKRTPCGSVISWKITDRVHESRFEVVLQYRDKYLSPLSDFCLQLFSSRCLMRVRLNFLETDLNGRSQNITPME